MLQVDEGSNKIFWLEGTYVDDNMPWDLIDDVDIYIRNATNDVYYDVTFSRDDQINVSAQSDSSA